jgi:hypothetical protein
VLGSERLTGTMVTRLTRHARVREINGAANNSSCVANPASPLTSDRHAEDIR